jgi:hypothetical protein
MASQSNVLLLLLLLGVMAVAVSAADVVPAGGADGWNEGIYYGTIDLHPGDSLVFSYPEGVHNVVQTDLNGYKGCYAGSNAPTWTSGNDKITFYDPQVSYYICTFAGHCNNGMKVIVNVMQP